jgi:predicted PurR-regulated permease PerM
VTLSARAVFSAALVLVLAVLSALVVLPFLTYLLAAVLLAFVLYPLHRRLSERLDPRLSAGALVSATILVVVLPAVAAVGAALDDLRALAEGETGLPALESLETLLSRRFGLNVALQSRLQSIAQDLPQQIASQAPSLLGGGIEFLLGALLLLFVEYYLLKDGDALASWILSSVPLPVEVGRELFEAAESMTRAVLKGHVLVAIAQGLVAGVGLFVAGIPNAALWTVAMAFLALIPVIGVTPVLDGATLYLVVQGRIVAAVLLLGYGATVVALTDDYLRALLVERGSASLHPAVILVGVFGATIAFGPMGLFFGPVILGLLKVTVEVFEDHYGVA